MTSYFNVPILIQAQIVNSNSYQPINGNNQFQIDINTGSSTQQIYRNSNGTQETYDCRNIQPGGWIELFRSEFLGLR
jgi:hypothetical protein